MTTTEDQKMARADWVRALRSGEYGQTIGYLELTIGDSTRPVGFCCLGVACASLPIPRIVDPVGFALYGDFGATFTTLPTEAVSLLGLVTGNPQVQRSDGTWEYLTYLNDDIGLTFDQIADLIEAQDEDWNGEPA